MDPTRRLPDHLVAHARAFTDGTTEPVEAKHASTVVLMRDGDGQPGGLEVYLLRRHVGMAFAAGMCVFPGGGVDPRDFDADIGWVGPTPTAERAWTPASPNTLPNSSEAPFATWGCPLKSGVDATNATTLTTRLTFASSPTSARTAAMALRAHCRAHSSASSGVTSPPTLPVAISWPSRIGSWPDVKTWWPLRTAGT